MANIYVLGAGCMGRAILSGLAREFGLEYIKVIEVDDKRFSCLVAEGFEVSKSISVIDSEDAVVLAVPPQKFQSAVRDNPLLISHGGPVISVMAGITINSLCNTLVNAKVVRSIPNIPSEIQEGVTLYNARDDADCNLIATAERVLGALGLCIRVNDERKIDSGTALVGGGPALIAYFANTMKLYAEREGFSSEVAHKISTQLLFGTSSLLRSMKKLPMQLCKEVQTAGGTTERAVRVFDESDLKGLVCTALASSAMHSVELGVSLSAKEEL